MYVCPPSLLGYGSRRVTNMWQFGTRTLKGDITITTRVQGVTVGAAAFFQGTAILHVLSNAIRVLEPGKSYKPSLCRALTLSSRQMEPSDKSLKIWRAIINAPGSNTVASVTHSCSFCARMTPSVCLLESPSAERSDEKTCRQWGRKWVSVSFCVGH